MLQHSDNTASNAIKFVLKGKINILDLGEYVDLESSVDEAGRLQLSARSYSTIFKCLYLACYNTKEHSQEILSKLTQTEFTNRLIKLLPEDTVVAHKIGTFNDDFQSDCGIVYANDQKSDYLICIMINAKDLESSQEIARLSYKVFTHVSLLIEPTEPTEPTE